MSGQLVLPDPTGVNHYNTDDRRRYMTKVFRQLGLWNDLENRLKAKGIRPACENIVNERMNKWGHLRVSEVAFEYFTDINIWRNTVNRDENTPWPWLGTPWPSETDPWLPISQTYRRWRLSHGMSIEEIPGRGGTAQQSARPPVEASQSPAGQTTTKSSTGPAVPAKVQAKKSAPATKVAADALVKRQVAKAPTKPPSATVAIQVDKVNQGAGNRAARHILECRYPTVSRDSALSGFDCLIVVLRCIYSNFMLDNGHTLSWIKEAEEMNPILRYACSLFGEDREEVKQDARNREHVLQTLGDSQSSFESLCSSSLMNETFWSQYTFRLFDGLICLGTTRHVDGSRTDFANASLLELDLLTDPSKSLEDVIQKSFGSIPFKDQWVLSRPNRPWVIRLLYTPDVNASRRLGINDFRVLNLPIWKQRENEQTACFDVVGKAEYFLMAVVRLRDDRFPQDFVRTYNIDGANIIPENPCDAFVNNSWSLKDDGGKYMLFYGSNPWPDLDDPTTFPEVARPIIPDEDVDLIEMLEKDLHQRRASSDKRQMPPPAPTV